MPTTKQNPLHELAGVGQAFWLDFIRRSFTADGSLKKLVDEDGLRGETSNPTIFEQAVAAGSEYDDDIRALIAEGADVNAIYERLATDDVRAACDVLRPVYDATNALDGYVSIEVSPALVHDTAGTIAEVKRLWTLVDRPNLMVKIPATREGLPAIEQSLTEGINVNITLIFAVERHIDVMRAFIRALRLRAQRGLSVERIASVASFFVSRVDTKVDKYLDAKIAVAQTDAQRQELESLKGKAAIANAKIAYEHFSKLFYTDEFADLRERGAQVQRPLWASTSTKNPAYRDVLYVEELIGPDTVDTMPPATINAFRDHGRVAVTLDKGLDEAHAVMDRLQAAGISMDRVTQELEDEGGESFSASFVSLVGGIAAKREAIVADFAAQQSAKLGNREAAVEKALDAAATNNVAAKVLAKDATLWHARAKANDPEISGWLGWLNAPAVGLAALPDLTSFVEQVRADGFTHAVVLGMGGSSLAPEVFRSTFGSRDARAGYPELHVLDSTDPANVLAVERAIDLPHTLFILSSKSGGTTEPNTFFAYFWDKVRASGAGNPGAQFIAITDAGTSVDKLGQEQGFRRVFTNDPQIGGRYSALSFFGLVPAALMGIDLQPVLERARAMAIACSPLNPPRQNPGVWLGTVLGELAQHGHDKITFLPSPSLDSFGLWAEQLIAESTGKEGKGLIPIAGEEAGPPEAYGKDRVFVSIHVGTDSPGFLRNRLHALEEAGNPVIRLAINEPADLGAEFFRWEFATAVAGGVLGINPFDQPNVQESKDNTKRLLAEFERRGSLPEAEVTASDNGVALTVSSNGHAKADGKAASATLDKDIARFLKSIKHGDYLALMAYLPYGEATEQALQRCRIKLRDDLKVATTLGYGPRFLHSTGQLHKGGPNSGVFIQITAPPAEDVPVPGEPYSFGVLEAAQALGDLQSLEKHGRRVIRLTISGDLAKGLRVLTDALVTN